MVSNNKGFTLTELIITIVIVGILSIIATYVYRVLLFKAVATEGKALMGSIANAEKTYYVQYGHFYGCDLPEGDTEGRTAALGEGGAWGERSYDPILGVDARGNTYFKNFKFVSATNDGVYVESKTNKPYKDLGLVLQISGMSTSSEGNVTISLYKWDENNITPIDIN
ncbi:type IV pilin protein [Candidatus Ruminimicrobium bovinum]|uniref:type IV pilin protein n=1 Tax=Candidatus Ruminimicrobium bovinum TaxID=3242779 RepID=UPI0039B94BC4